MIIKAGSALIGGEVLESVLLEVVDGRIASLNAVGVPEIEVAGTLIPGFVDIHCHGGAGFYFGSENSADIQKVIDIHRAHGTTTTLASLVTEPIEDLKAQIKRLLPFVQSGEIAGIHLEGPYLSPHKCGAHDPELLRHPKPSELQELLDVADGAISMVTLAPELPHGIEAIEFLVERGVVAAIGHSNANAEIAKMAMDAGATIVTHFYNGLPKIDHKDPNITLTTLLDDRVALELINDGHHVDEGASELLLRTAPGRVILVTDAMSAAGGGDGNYTIGQLPVEVNDGVARLVSNGSLAGSTLTMQESFEKLIHTFGTSIEYASFCASTLPAQTLGIEYVGSIAIGKLAHFNEIVDGKVVKTYRF
jgi:N-acetylglucosamine-6-phosphate deacetylase